MIFPSFVGDWAFWPGFLLALIAGGGAWWFYYRESRRQKGRLRWILPTLRALAVFLIVMMLTGPVIRHRRSVGQLARILVYVDASSSMSVSDTFMTPGRKLLVAARRGWLPEGLILRDLLEAQSALARAHRQATDSLQDITGKESASEMAETFRQDIEAAYESLRRLRAQDIQSAVADDDKQAGSQVSLQDLRQSFLLDVVEPARVLSKWKREADSEFNSRISGLLMKVEEYQQRLSHAFQQWGEGLVASGNQQAKDAVARFDSMPRWERLQASLLEGGSPILADLARMHNVEVLAMTESSLVPLWRGHLADSGGAGAFPKSFDQTADGVFSNLGLALEAAIQESAMQVAGAEEDGEQAEAERDGLDMVEPVAAVLLSDGRHNQGPSPLRAARMAGGRDVPVYTVGFGALEERGDVAILGVEAPDSIFHKDRVRGKILLNDTMTREKDYEVRIIANEEVVWRQKMQASGAQRQMLEYDFSLEELLAKQVQEGAGELRNLPVSMKVELRGLDNADSISANNEWTTRMRGIFKKNRLLLIDGRPRWEYRYLKNLFSRDERWNVNSILYDPLAADMGFARGNEEGQFPDERNLLMTYDLIILGDFPSSVFQQEELEWIRDFVSIRGGGLILVDGSRDNLRGYGNTAIEPLFPVNWNGEDAGRPSALRLTEKGVLRLTQQGQNIAALSLSSRIQDNVEIWNELKPPHWLAPVTGKSGAEVLMEAVVQGQPTPALVFMRYGAGKVFYSALDESWRWRFRVADMHHARYWNQIGTWIMASPFSASDRFVSIDAGPLSYSPGQSAEIRAQVRDEQGRPITDAVVTAIVMKGEDVVASLPMEADKERGQFVTETAPLEKGEYDVRLQVAGYPQDQLQASAKFFVEAPEVGEMSQLTLNEEFLKRIAANATGEYYREENAAELVERLRPLSREKIVESDTPLWESYMWFVPILFLLTADWVLRKRAGMI